MPERFISEAIQPVVETYDTARMATGEPGLPREFVWRGRTIQMASVLRTWREMAAVQHQRAGQNSAEKRSDAKSHGGKIMPLVRIALFEGRSAADRKKIGDVVHQAMVETINCPPLDRFQLITEHAKDNFLYAPLYLDIPHTDDLIVIQITLNEGRTVELKKALYKAIAEGLHRSVGVEPRDVFISLVEVKKENWSFGNGIAQYAG